MLNFRRLDNGEGMLYGVQQQMVDYIRLPVNFDRYSAADQTGIVNRMLAVRQADDCEQYAPDVTPLLSLKQALARLKSATA